jgi:DHA2 family multidrug resistance protein-like MFS transporter
MLTPVAAQRFRPAHVVAAGAVLAACGFLVLALIDGDDGLTAIVVGSVITALGLSPILTLGTDLILTAAPPERAGSASAVSETSSELGGALGIAVLGSIGIAVYRSQVEESVPAGVPPDVADAARDTLGAAVASGEGLSADVAGPLLDVSRDAFAAGLQLTAVVSAALMAACAVLALTVLGRRGPQPSPASSSDEADDRSSAQPLMQ